jgi:hypothetical protein
MRFDSQKGFPYPVLRPDIDDYQSGEFQTTVDLIRSQNDKKIRVKIHTALSIEEIRDEVAKGRAAVSIIIACRETYFRDAIVTNKFDIEKSFDSGMFRGEVEISPFIVATKPISKFRCRDINSEFASREFSFEIGEVLAADAPKFVYIDRELFKPISSIVQLVKQDALVGYDWRLRFDDNKIQIMLSPEAKQVVDLARNSRSNRAVLIIHFTLLHWLRRYISCGTSKRVSVICGGLKSSNSSATTLESTWKHANPRKLCSAC